MNVFKILSVFWEGHLNFLGDISRVLEDVQTRSRTGRQTGTHDS